MNCEEPIYSLQPAVMLKNVSFKDTQFDI